MPDYLKISELPAASSVAGTDQIELNQAGTSRSATLAVLTGAQSIILFSTITSVSAPVPPTAFGFDITSSNTTGGTYSSVTGLFTVPTDGAGVWDVQINVQGIATPTPYILILELTLNGTTVCDTITFIGPPGGGTATLNRKIVVAASNTIGLKLSCPGGGTINGTNAGTRNSWMCLTRIGA